MSFEQLAILLIVGALAGWLAGLILHRRGFDPGATLIVGVVGSVLGRFVLGLVGFSAHTTLATLITAVLGAVLLLWLLAFLLGNPRRKK